MSLGIPHARLMISIMIRFWGIEYSVRSTEYSQYLVKVERNVLLSDAYDQDLICGCDCHWSVTALGITRLAWPFHQLLPDPNL